MTPASAAAGAASPSERNPGAELPSVEVRLVVRRMVRIAAVITRRLAAHGLSRLRARVTGDRPDRDDQLLRTLIDLGPAFVKVAQMLSTRADLLPPERCRALAALYNDVGPMPRSALRTALVSAWGADAAERLLREVDQPMASGSIACVYRGTLPDGRAVALKVRRPGIEPVLRTDLAIMRRLARLLSLVPGLRGVPVAEIVFELTGAVYAQLDFARELNNLAALGGNLAEQANVRVPRVYPELSSAEVLAMEYLDGLRRRDPEEMTAEHRTESVTSALHAVYQMLFLDGLVHCDLHPGNLILGPGATVSIVDAGFTVRLTQQAQDRFTSFFYYMSVGKGEKCAEVVLSTAKPGPRTDVDGFRTEIVELIRASTGVAAADFDLVHFATQLFAIQRRHGLYADPQFVFPILSLLVLEGAVRDFAPRIDFQDEALPFLAQAMIGRTLQMSRQQDSGL